MERSALKVKIKSTPYPVYKNKTKNIYDRLESKYRRALGENCHSSYLRRYELLLLIACCYMERQHADMVQPEKSVSRKQNK